MFSRKRAPASVRTRLDGNERVLASGSTAGGTTVVATNLGLWWPEEPPRRIPWQLIDKAAWTEVGLLVVEADVVDDLFLVDRPAAVVALAQEGKLPPTVRRRVEASVVRSLEVRTSAGVALVVGRRVPGRDGVTWWARPPRGATVTDGIRAELEDVVGRLREQSSAELNQL
ncbi:MAG: hypothetical protein ABJA87_01935 [bacterium]